MPESRAVLGQVVLSFLIASLLFMFLRLISRFVETKEFLRTIAGATALVGFPLFALSFQFYFGGPIYFLSYHSAGFYYLLVEVLVVLVCGVFFYLRKWPVPTLPSILLLVFHFGLWAWITGSYLSFTMMDALFRYGILAFLFWTIFDCGLPIIGFLSSLTWSLYIKSPVNLRSPIKVAPAQ
jgi:hypothetical protein